MGEFPFNGLLGRRLRRCLQLRWAVGALAHMEVVLEVMARVDQLHHPPNSHPSGELMPSLHGQSQPPMRGKGMFWLNPD